PHGDGGRAASLAIRTGPQHLALLRVPAAAPRLRRPHLQPRVLVGGARLHRGARRRRRRRSGRDRQPAGEAPRLRRVLLLPRRQWRARPPLRAPLPPRRRGPLVPQFLRHVEPQNFTITESLALFAAVIVGGLGSVEGALFGAAFVVLVPALGSE